MNTSRISGGYDPSKDIKALKRQDGLKTQAQRDAIANLENNFYQTKDKADQKKIIKVLAREIDGAFMRGREDSATVRERSLEALLKIIGKLNEQVPPDVELLQFIAVELKGVGNNKLSSGEKTLCRKLYSAFLYSANLLRKELQFKSSYELLEKTLEIDPDHKIYQDKKSTIKDKEVILEIHEEMYFCGNALEEKDYCVESADKFIEFSEDKNNVDLYKLEDRDLKQQVENMKNFKAVADDPDSEASQAIMRKQFQQMLYGGSNKSYESTMDHLRISQEKDSYIMGGVKGSHTQGQESQFKIFGEWGTAYNEAKTGYISRNLGYSTDFENMNKNIIEGGVKLTQHAGRTSYQEYLQLRWSKYEGLSGNVGANVNYLVKSENVLFNNALLAAGADWKFMSQMITPYQGPIRFDTPKVLTPSGSYLNSINPLQNGIAPQAPAWARPNQVFRQGVWRNLTLSAGASNGWYLGYISENNYCISTLSGSASTYQGIDVGVETRVAATPCPGISFDVAAKASIYRLYAEAEMELGPDPFYVGFGIGTDLGPYALIGTRKFKPGFLAMLLGPLGNELEIKVGAWGMSLGVTANRPGDKGARLVISWIPPFIIPESYINPGRINRYNDGSAGTSGTALNAQIIDPEGRTTSYVQKIGKNRRNEYKITDTPPPKKKKFWGHVLDFFKKILIIPSIIERISKKAIDRSGTRTVSQVGNEYHITDKFDDGHEVRYVLRAKDEQNYEQVKVLIKEKGEKSFKEVSDMRPHTFNEAEWAVAKLQLSSVRDNERKKELIKAVASDKRSPLEKAKNYQELVHIYQRMNDHEKAMHYIKKAHELAAEQVKQVKNVDSAKELEIVNLYSEICYEYGLMKINAKVSKTMIQEGYSLVVESENVLEKHMDHNIPGKYQALLKIAHAKSLLKENYLHNLTDEDQLAQEQVALQELKDAVKTLEQAENTPEDPSDRELLSDAYHLLGQQGEMEVMRRDQQGIPSKPSDFKNITDNYLKMLEFKKDISPSDYLRILDKLHKLPAKGIPELQFDTYINTLKKVRDQMANDSRLEKSFAKESLYKADRAIANTYFDHGQKIDQVIKDLESQKAAVAKQYGPQAVDELAAKIKGLTRDRNSYYKQAYQHYKAIYDAGDKKTALDMITIIEETLGPAHETTQKRMDQLIEGTKDSQGNIKDKYTYYELTIKKVELLIQAGKISEAETALEVLFDGNKVVDNKYGTANLVKALITLLKFAKAQNEISDKKIPEKYLYEDFAGMLAQLNQGNTQGIFEMMSQYTMQNIDKLSKEELLHISDCYNEYFLTQRYPSETDYLIKQDRAMIMAHLGDKKEAIKLLEEDKDKQSMLGIDAKLKLAELYKEDDPDEAADLMEEADEMIAKNPEMAVQLFRFRCNILAQRAKLCTDMEEYEDAWDAYAEAIKILKETKESIENLAKEKPPRNKTEEAEFQTQVSAFDEEIATYEKAQKDLEAKDPDLIEKKQKEKDIAEKKKAKD
ncbi:hypothetical protein ACFL5G_01790 [Candidatus Margulisiibacteriota bacterium]